MNKGLPWKREVLLCITVLAVILMTTCKDQGTDESQYIVYVKNGEFKKTIDVDKYGLESGQYNLHPLFRWNGDDTVSIDFEAGFYYYNDSLFGVNLKVLADKIEDIPNPEMITMVVSDVQHSSLIEHFPNVECLDYSVYEPSSIDFQYVEDLENLKVLYVSGSKIYWNPGDLDFLAKLPNLQILWLPGTLFGASLEPLTSLRDLRRLVLPKEVAQGELVHIQNLKNLRSLSIHNGAITDNDLQNITGLTELRSLSLWGCEKITNAATVYINNFKELRSLELGMTQFTQIGKLKDLAHLKYLYIEGTRITDSDLKAITHFPNLTELDMLDCTMITDKGITNLKKLKHLKK